MSSNSELVTLDSRTLFVAASQNSLPAETPSPLSSSRSPLFPIPPDFPQSKIIPKTRFIVDGFRYAGDHSVSYFLSHFHFDHYTGLTPNWSKGIIFCSHTTARLLVEFLRIPSVFAVSLSLYKPVLVDGCEVVLLDANHCPGAVQFLFKVPRSDGTFDRYVHTGDFRYCDSMKSEAILGEFIGADAIFLDTTYCNPKFVFPSQEESIDYIVDVILRIGAENEGSLKKVLFLVATYVIGKERILLEISRRCNRKIHVDGRKMAIMSILGLGKDGVFTDDKSESDVHVVGWDTLGETWPYFRPNFGKMSEVMNETGYSKIVGFVPTGWTYEVKRNKFAVKKKDSFELHLVPYSEHSNYDELREYVKFLKPKRVIPTVGLDVQKPDSKRASAMQKHFNGLVDEMAIKQEFLMSFHNAGHVISDKVEKGFDTSLNLVVVDKKHATSVEFETRKRSVHADVLNSFCQHEPSSQEMFILSENDIEEMIQEFSDCLPMWVTRSQMLELLRTSGNNVIEAVSYFYEHETEFHEQVAADSTSSDCQSYRNSLKDSELPFEPHLVTSSPIIELVSSSQSFKSPIKMHGTNASLSPRKKRKNVDQKRNRKGKIKSHLESGGLKQCTITHFFNKQEPPVSHDGGCGTVSNQGHDDDNLLPNYSKRPYKEEVDQFLQIINGNDSLRSYVATILEQTQGNINMALDIYFSNPDPKIQENKEISEDSSKFFQAQFCMGISSSYQAAEASEKPETSLSVCGSRTDSVAMSHVFLPPEKYCPVKHACWRDGQPAPYIHLARTFDLVEDEKGKIKAMAMLCNMFRSLLALSPEDVLPAVYLCTNKIAPAHKNVDLNIGGSTVVAALEEACGTNRSKIRELYNSLGDLGDVAQLCRQTQSLLAPPAPLTIRGVFSVLQKISLQTGNSSTARKKSFIVHLMRSCREKEIKFLVRTLVRNLRIGAMMRTVLSALAQAVVMNSSLCEGTVANLKDQLLCISTAVVEAFNIIPNLDLLIPSLMENGVTFSTTTLSMVPGIPIKPMLAKITNGVTQVLELFQNKAFTCEYKYDGQRAQIHRLGDGSVHVFSRNGDETTSRFPDLVNIIEKYATAAETFILDAEVVAVDRKNGRKLLSFQELSSRERGSRDSCVSVDNVKVDICIFVFDIMFMDGEQMLGFPLRQRRRCLKDLFCDNFGYLECAKEITVEAEDACAINVATLTKMNCFLDDAIRSSCEGIMVKYLDVDAGYIPSKRSDSWLKVKRDYVEELNESLDLVPIGAWHGNGRKAGWYSPFLMACYNPDTEEFQSICRVMSGFSDSFYIEMKKFFSEEKVLTKKPPYYQTDELPDIWFSAELVWEIRGADLTVSPVHHAAIGLVQPSRGISVRFPRFIRCVSDRKAEDCSTSIDVAEMFHSQTRKMGISFEQ